MDNRSILERVKKPGTGEKRETFILKISWWRNFLDWRESRKTDLGTRSYESEKQEFGSDN